MTLRTWSCVVTDPRDEAPLTLSDVKLHCRVGATVTDEDDLLEAYRLTSADVVESEAEIALGTQTRVLASTAFPDDDESLRLPYPPLQEVLSVQYRDANGAVQTWDPSNYDVVTSGRFGAIVPKVGRCYPRTRCNVPDAVVVTFVCGYESVDDIPRRYLQAQRLLIAHWYANREAVGSGMTTVPLGFDVAIGTPARLESLA